MVLLYNYLEFCGVLTRHYFMLSRDGFVRKCIKCTIIWQTGCSLSENYIARAELYFDKWWYDKVSSLPDNLGSLSEPFVTYLGACFILQ
jgi:hypothetical protein